MAEETILHLDGVRLAVERGSGYGPLNLSLKAGEGAIVTCGDLDVLRGLMRCCLGERAADGGSVFWWTAA